MTRQEMQNPEITVKAWYKDLIPEKALTGRSYRIMKHIFDEYAKCNDFSVEMYMDGKKVFSNVTTDVFKVTRINDNYFIIERQV